MKKVVLIGDSIRMGYQTHVHRELEGYAEVWGPAGNCGTSENVLDHLAEWVLSRQPDVVHINAGLHDTLRSHGSTANRVPLDQYYRNVRKIVSTIQAKTEARLIWATTTTIDQEVHNTTTGRVRGYTRFSADIVTYNEGVVNLARRLGFEINGLHEAFMSAGPDEILANDAVHFTDDGYARLGRWVADFIRG